MTDPPAVAPPAPGAARQAALGRHIALVIAAVFALFVFSPTFWNEIGADAKDWYAAGILSAEGGNPYSPAQQFAAEERIFNQPQRLRRGDPAYYAPQAYAYPPLLTRALELGRGLDERTFFLALLGIFLAAGMAGFELCLALAPARRRWDLRIFFLASSPMVLALFVGNPSPVLLLCWAAGAVLLRRGRSVAAGMVLSLTLVKLPVGLPVALAALAFGPVGGRPAPRARAIAAASFSAAGAAWLGLAALVGRSGSLGQWIRALTTFQGELSNPVTSGIKQSGLAGLPGLLLGIVSTPVAIAVTLPVVLAVLAYGLRRAGHTWQGEGSSLTLALGTAAALAASPYLHVNDLVLEALPLLVLLQAGKSLLTGTTLTLAALFLPVSLVFTAAVVLATGHLPPGQAGLGALLSTMVLVAVARTRPTPRPVPPLLVSETGR